MTIDSKRYSDPDCTFLPKVSAFHDGELPPDEGQRVCRHVQSCQSCFSLLAFLERASHALATLGPTERRRLVGCVSVNPRRSIVRIAAAPADVRWSRRLTVAAAVFFFAAIGRSVYLQSGPESGMPSGMQVPARPVQHRMMPGQQATDQKTPTLLITDSVPCQVPENR